MKRMFGLLIVLSIIYFGAQFLFGFIDKGHSTSYEMTIDDKTYKINEVYTRNTENEQDGYYINIEVEDKVFDYQIFEDLNSRKKVVSNVLYYSDSEYTCILPIFVGDKLISDMMCLNNGNYSLYHNIIGINTSLDTYINTLDKYDVNNFNDKTEYTEELGLNIYDLYDLDYTLIESYRGLYVISNLETSYISNYRIFDNDVYNRPISAFVKNYYVVADYDQETKFNKFYVLNYKNGKQEEIIYAYDISLNSYVQGVINDSIYIFDRDNLKQYEVNVKTNTVIEVGNEEAKIKTYSDFKFTSINAYDAKNKDIYFNEYTTSNELNGKTYYKVDKTGNELSGNYYVYEQVAGGFNLYRAPIKDSYKLVYLFTLTNINDVVYDGSDVYYRNSNQVKYYNDLLGERTIVTYNELGFNSNLKTSIYK